MILKILCLLPLIINEEETNEKENKPRLTKFYLDSILTRNIMIYTTPKSLPMLYQRAFSVDKKNYPVYCEQLSDMWLSTFEIRAASLRYRNHAEITCTVLMCEAKPYQVWFSYRCKTIRCSVYITLGSLPCTTTKSCSENDPKKIQKISVARLVSPLYIWTLTSIAPVMARSRVQTPLKSWIFFRLLYAIA